MSPVRPRVIEALLSFGRLEAVRLEAYSSLETARCFCALRHLPLLTHLDLRLSGSSFALDDNLEALTSLAACSRLVRSHPPIVVAPGASILLVWYCLVHSSFWFGGAWCIHPILM